MASAGGMTFRAGGATSSGGAPLTFNIYAQRVDEAEVRRSIIPCSIASTARVGNALLAATDARQRSEQVPGGHAYGIVGAAHCERLLPALPLPRSGTAKLALAGSYTGAEEALYEIEILDATVEVPLISASV